MRETLTFFTFPREIRDHIYNFLIPNEKAYTIISANATLFANPLSTSGSLFGIINASKAVRYEILEKICPYNVFRFSFPRSGISPQTTYTALLPLITHVEIHIDLGRFHWERFRTGFDDPEILNISEQVCEMLRMWNKYSAERESCRVSIRDGKQFMSSLLGLPLFHTIKTLVDLETLQIIMLKTKPDMRKLGAVLGPNLGPSTLHYEWPTLDPVQSGYGCIQFHPRAYLGEQSR